MEIWLIYGASIGKHRFLRIYWFNRRTQRKEFNHRWTLMEMDYAKVMDLLQNPDTKNLVEINAAYAKIGARACKFYPYHA